MMNMIWIALALVCLTAVLILWAGAASRSGADAWTDDYIKRVLHNRFLPRVATDLTLDSGEDVFYYELATMYGPKNVSHRRSIGVGGRILGPLFGGVSAGTSETEKEWRLLDSGRLAVTNKRVLFIGALTSCEMAMWQILLVQSAAGLVELVGDKNRGVFGVVNPRRLEFIIKICRSAADPRNLKETEIKIK
jgi:hypothetical protein